MFAGTRDRRSGTDGLMGLVGLHSVGANRHFDPTDMMIPNARFPIADFLLPSRRLQQFLILLPEIAQSTQHRIRGRHPQPAKTRIADHVTQRFQAL